jgi:hypothetical protein
MNKRIVSDWNSREALIFTGLKMGLILEWFKFKIFVDFEVN